MDNLKFNSVCQFRLDFAEMADENDKLSRQKGRGTTSRGWLTLVYPESAPEGWKDKLASVGMQAIISPLHDKDLNATKEQKKPHYHVLLYWEGPTTRNNALKYVEMIGGVGCIPCASVRGSARYFCHLDNPEKAQYSKDDVKTICGLDYNLIITSDSDDMLAYFDIIDFIERNHLISFRKLMLYCRSYNTDWAKLLLTKYRENVFRYMRSFEQDLGEGRLAFCPEYIKEREDAFESGSVTEIKNVELSGYMLSDAEIENIRNRTSEMQVQKKRKLKGQ